MCPTIGELVDPYKHNQCYRKEVYETEAEAWWATARVRRTPGFEIIRPYQCNVCAKWHLGRPREWRSRFTKKEET